MKIAIVIPLFNEEKVIKHLIKSFENQKNKNFHLIFVDNNSTDSSIDIIKNCLYKEKEFTWEIIHESQKGTGAACDTGFRYAIEKLKFQYIARTDADCIPDNFWVAEIIKSFENQDLDFLCGKILPKKEIGVTWLDLVVARFLIHISSIYGKITRPGKQFKYPYLLVAGNNLAISANMYIKSGGFLRVAIDDINEDDELAEVIRTLTNKVQYNKNMVVLNSLRRLKKYGYYKTIMWYKQRAYKPLNQSDIDIR